MNEEKLSAEEMLELMSSQWASTKDIMKIGSVGRNKAYAIKNEIAISYYNENNRLRNRGLVPMKEVLKYFGIDIEYLKDCVVIKNGTKENV